MRIVACDGYGYVGHSYHSTHYHIRNHDDFYLVEQYFLG